jgi:hypothetical protein
VGSNANAVTEPGWQKVQFWCSVIHPHIRGTVTRTHAADCDQYRDGVQLLADKRNEDTGEWAELRFNLSAAEARSLAAQLLPLLTATTKIGADAFIMRRLEKIADHLGADILVPSHISERR